MNEAVPKCESCRRAGKKLFLKGERCFSAKCAIIKKPYAPGQHAKKGAILTEYGRQLREKQILKWSYGLRERQFKKYYQEASKKEGNFSDILIGRLETRLDNVIYRLNFADSRKQARQLVSHGFFLVNNRTVNVPSYQVKVGDEIAFKASKENKGYTILLKDSLEGKKKKETPAWLDTDTKNLKGKLVAVPTKDDISPEADPQAVIEFYSR